MPPDLDGMFGYFLSTLQVEVSTGPSVSCIIYRPSDIRPYIRPLLVGPIPQLRGGN